MEEWNSLIGKELKIIFEDGDNHVSKKEGKFVDTTDTHIILEVNGKTEGISKSKIIRFEVIER
jgi:ribosome maturation factor RimP